MATITFKEQYLHPNWQRKRLEVMEAAGFSCENCGETEVTLNVHHKRYVRGRMVWEYERSELQCLCQPCHESEHASRRALEMLVMAAPAGYLPSLVALIAGFLDGQLLLDENTEVSQFVGDRTMEFEIGLLASMLDGLMPDSLLSAAKAARNLEHVTPSQQGALDRWCEFADKLEKSGL